MSMTYSSLKASVADYLHRTDLTTPIIQFVENARLRIGGDLRGAANFTTATVTSFSNGLAALPVNLGKLVSVTDSDGFNLQPMSLDLVQNWSSGVYAVAGTDLYVPDAGSATVITLAYYAIPDPLVNAGDVSVPMLEYPQIWLYACLAEGAMYCNDFEAAGQWNGAYQELILQANRAGYEARFAAPAISSDQVNIQTMAVL